MITTTYAKADKINGVLEIDISEYPDAEMLSVKGFIAALPYLDDDETIFTVFSPADEEEYFLLDKKYGIH